MALVNEHYLKLKSGYLFPEIARRVQAFTEANPKADIIRLGIGDVTQPLPPARRPALMPFTGRWMKWPMRKPSGDTGRSRVINF